MKKVLLAMTMAVSFTSMEATASWPFTKKADAVATQTTASVAPAKPGMAQRIKQGASAVGSSMKAGMVQAGQKMATGATAGVASVKAGAAKAGTSMRSGVVTATAGMAAGVSAMQAKVQNAVTPKPWVDAVNSKIANAGMAFETNITTADAAHEAAYINAKSALGITFVQAFTKDINTLLASPKVQLADKADYLASLTTMIAGLSSNAAIAKHLPGVVSELEGVRAQAYNQVVAQLIAAASRHALSATTPQEAYAAPLAAQPQAMVQSDAEADEELLGDNASAEEEAFAEE